MAHSSTGAARLMAVGSLILALGFVPLALWPTAATFILAWLCFGLAGFLSLAALAWMLRPQADARPRHRG